MRIVAGRYRGRTLKAPAGDSTRPTTDRVREAVFSAVAALAGSDLGGGVVLDAFAGSGALGLEALSRGCSRAVFVEQDTSALAVLRGNISGLDALDGCIVVGGDVTSLAARGHLPGGAFSLLLLDPPYRLDPAAVAMLLGSLAANAQIERGAIAVWEHASNAGTAWPEGFDLQKRKRYGTTEVDIAVYEGGARAT